MVGERTGHGLAVADIQLFEGVAWTGTDLGERLEVAGIGQLVDVDHAVAGVADEVTDDGRTDEAGAAGDENFHVSAAPVP
ncbi:hypothetical protein D3C81_2243520 [compost metagenome]